MANYCIYCGASLPPDAQLCPRCGRLIPEVDAPPAEPAAEPLPVEAEETAPVAPAEEEAPAPPPEDAAAASPQLRQEAPPEAAPAYAAPRPPQPPLEAPRAAAPKYVPMGLPVRGLTENVPADLLTTGGVLGMVLLGLLPLVGWIVLLVWAFDAASGPNHRALAKGLLLAKLIVGVLVVLLVWLLMFLLTMWPYYWY